MSCCAGQLAAVAEERLFAGSSCQQFGRVLLVPVIDCGVFGSSLGLLFSGRSETGLWLISGRERPLRFHIKRYYCKFTLILHIFYTSLKLPLTLPLSIVYTPLNYGLDGEE